MRESAGHEAAEQETEKHGSGVVGEERKDSAFGERPISGRCCNSESNFSISTRRYFATSLCPYCIAVINQLKKKKKKLFKTKLHHFVECIRIVSQCYFYEMFQVHWYFYKWNPTFFFFLASL